MPADMHGNASGSTGKHILGVKGRRIKPGGNSAGQGIVTFTGADHLQHHLSGAAGVQPRLLVQDLLLFHLFFLSNTHALRHP